MKELISVLTDSKDSPLIAEKLLDVVERYATCENTLAYLGDQILGSTERANGYIHQLGFYKFVVANIDGTFPRRIRLHFWKKGEVKDDVHDHVASFASKVLYGSLINECFEHNGLGEAFIHKEFSARGESCHPEGFANSYATLSLQSRTEMGPLTTYFQDYRQLHRAGPATSEVVTLLVQDAPNDRMINVFRERNFSSSDRSDTPMPMSVSQARNAYMQMRALLGGAECK
ncbi:hypothetical protein PQQ96_29275 [Paraburkholderia sediminicola]|uniref:hypothetical protein n=1 Tax=Paraburkholderia sediminicola TaxID=458836 RepID=UPI0038B6D5C2